MKSLFREDGWYYSQEGAQFSDSIEPILKSILEEGVSKGYSIRDMEFIIMNKMPLIASGVHMRYLITQKG